MFIDSLRNRIRAMNTLWERAVGDMTLEHVNHHARPGNPVRNLEVLECFVFQHGIRHLGEIEYARALVGLTGVSNL